MSSFIHKYLFFFIIFSTVFVLPFITAAPTPVVDSPYDKFIEFLSKNNCTMPKEVQLPFPPSSDPLHFSYLSSPLNECRTLDALKENDGANLLCREVFDVLQNITCFEYSEPLPVINSSHLSETICSDFKRMQDILPKQNDYLSGKLVDGTLCKLFCTNQKYELLCKIVLWSYDTQAKIKNALENKEKENEKESVNEVSSDRVPSAIKISLVQNKSESNNQELNEESDKSKNFYIPSEDKGNSLESGSHPNENEQKSSDTKISSDLDPTNSNKLDLPANNNQEGSKIGDTPNNPETAVLTTNTSDTDKQKVSQTVTDNKTVQSTELSSSTSNQNLPVTHIDTEKNEINVDKKPQKAQVTDNLTEVNSATNGNSFTSNNNGMEGSENAKNMSESTLQNKEKTEKDKNSDSKKVSGEPEKPVLPNTEMDNELNNVDLQEHETKAKQTDLKSDDKVAKPELTDFETPNKPSSAVDSKLTESSTMQVFPDEDAEQHQEDKDQEQYNDTENDADYPKAEYDNSLNSLPKNKEPDVKSSVVVGSSQISNSYDLYPRNNIGRVPDDIPMIPSFPEQEDSHFFFYFLSIVLILMAGYLIFHNKQKIIALIVEGRHERRRRSHGAGYKKLETK